MKTDDFNFDLPLHLIAQVPPVKRGDSRLLTLDRKTAMREHKTVLQLPEILCTEHFLSEQGEKPLLVFNDTKVRKARLIGKSLETDASVEFLLLEKNDIEEWKVLVQRSSRRKTGSCYVFKDENGMEIARAEITKAEGEFKFIKFEKPIDEQWLEKNGHIPLPPYIKRKDVPSDADRYQTIYAKQTGSAAAPTAGLHFTDAILKKIADYGIESAFITLHVGLGTFVPVRTENIEDHIMHEEQFIITEKNASIIENAISRKRKIIAVGTTSLRTLESTALNNVKWKNNNRQKTSIFIYPGFQFKIVDALFTNFHTPLSTLLMLVSAFASYNGVSKTGRDLILESYKEAILEEYRFFSYGDAMLIF
ncbi:MAG: tRNA preQ1(34) S-adenosylmethionine ribosyltransferase-isomerase QueA [Treponema sp.]|nr:tRNA preQ1(34) S-adenosylmethionine ribosyltransferase-isomerase QueA [Treponema sp.]MCL2252397.1 tRNA preQ1(34) S-adenosylmethionine ribosyltransferase-isomerase QueA [Treponema sp.]